MKRTRTRPVISLLAVAAITVTACSNSSTASTTTVTTTVPVETTVAEITTTTEDPIEVAAKISNEARRKELDRINTEKAAIQATKDAIAAAIVQSRQDYIYAVTNYDAPDALEVLARTTVLNSPSYKRGVENMETLRSNGWKIRLNTDVSDSLTVEGDVTLLDGPPATKAEVTVCGIDTLIVYEPNSGPNGEDAIINDAIQARRNRSLLVLEDGVWKLRSGENLGTWDGVTSCPVA
jgi:hypothetical protein